MWLFHPHSAVKIQPCYPVFPLAESTANVFCRLFLWGCKEKTSTIFRIQPSFSRRNGLPPHSLPPVKIFAGGAGENAFYKRLHHGMWLFHLHSAVKMQPFYPVFPVAESTANVFCWLFLWGYKEKSINHFYDTAFLFPTERTPAAQPPHQSKFLRVGPGRMLFIKGSIMTYGCSIPTVP